MSRHALIVIAPQKFRDEEYAVPRDILLARGARVTTASTAAGSCVGKLGMKAVADIALSDANAADYDAIIFVGGAGASVFFDDPVAHALARNLDAAGKIVSAICIAPTTLARAGLLRNVNATAFVSQAEDLKAHGAFYTGAPVEIAARIITANGPEAAEGFGNAVADALGL